MSMLEDQLTEYLALRKALGFNLRPICAPLKDFVQFTKIKNAKTITTQLALDWATKPDTATSQGRAYRLRLVHHFALYVRATDPETEVPPMDLLPYYHRRQSPHIYSEQEITCLLAAARKLPSRSGLRGLTYSTILGLLWVTGLRISEALALNKEDVDLTTGLLTINKAKFGKTRLVPVHPSACSALGHYARRRDQVFIKPKSLSFFVTIFGTRPTYAGIAITFRQICRQIGIREANQRKGPRIHDLRHSFAVRSLIDIQKKNSNVDQKLHTLSVYLGHIGPTSTYWYFSAVPELMELACHSLERKESAHETHIPQFSATDRRFLYRLPHDAEARQQ
jgi:integrase